MLLALRLRQGLDDCIPSMRSTTCPLEREGGVRSWSPRNWNGDWASAGTALPKYPGGFPSSNQSTPCTGCWGAEWVLDGFLRGGSHLLGAAHWNSSHLISQRLHPCIRFCWVETLREYIWCSSDTTVCSFTHQSSWVRPVELLMSTLSQTAGSMFWGSSCSRVADHRSGRKISASGTGFFVIIIIIISY